MSVNVVLTTVNYDYDILRSNIVSLKQAFPFLETGIIGYSVLGKAIPFLKIGTGPKRICYAASFHANEWITSPLLMKFTQDYLNAYQDNTTIYGYNARFLFSSTSLYLIPMVNPDGVNLVTGNISEPGIYQSAKKIADQFPTIPFPSGWKANINGVDFKNYQPVCKVL